MNPLINALSICVAAWGADIGPYGYDFCKFEVLRQGMELAQVVKDEREPVASWIPQAEKAFK